MKNLAVVREESIRSQQGRARAIDISQGGNVTILLKLRELQIYLKKYQRAQNQT